MTRAWALPLMISLGFTLPTIGALADEGYITDSNG